MVDYRIKASTVVTAPRTTPLPHVSNSYKAELLQNLMTAKPYQLREALEVFSNEFASWAGHGACSVLSGCTVRTDCTNIFLTVKKSFLSAYDSLLILKDSLKLTAIDNEFVADKLELAANRAYDECLLQLRRILCALTQTELSKWEQFRKSPYPQRLKDVSEHFCECSDSFLDLSEKLSKEAYSYKASEAFPAIATLLLEVPEIDETPVEPEILLAELIEESSEIEETAVVKRELKARPLLQLTAGFKKTFKKEKKESK